MVSIALGVFESTPNPVHHSPFPIKKNKETQVFPFALRHPFTNLR